MLRISLGIRILICTLFVFLPLSNLDQWLYDQFFHLRGTKKRETPFVLIKVSDTKIFQLLEKERASLPPSTLTIEQGNLSLWHRQFYENILSKISKCQPKLVVFTQFYDWIDHRNSNALPFDRLIFAGMINDENRPIPPSRLTRGENYGFNNLFPDSDNTLRQSRLYYSYGSSLALTAYKAVVSTPIKRNLLEPLWIDFRGPNGSYPTYNAWDLYNSETIDPKLFEGKIVLIGKESSPSSDVETPFGKMSRLEVQANILDTFIDQRELTLLPRSYSRLLAAVGTLLTGAIVLFFPLTLAWFILLLSCGLLLLFTLLLFSEFHLWLGIANTLFCMFGTYIVMLGYKLGRQEEEAWHIEQEAKYLRELDQFKNNFISLFSHDLKTPIAKIKAMTDRVLTEHKELPKDIVEALKGIDRTSLELARLISDILKVTRMESMSIEPNKEVLDINRLVETSANDLRFLAEEKHISLVLDLEPLFSIEGDPKLIREVITNLVENAIKYSPERSRIVIRTLEKDNEVHVCVADQGVGIAPDEIPRVVGKFYRAKATSAETKGSGLGLYLANYFVELHHGKLHIKSEVGRGTEVSFSLPIQA